MAFATIGTTGIADDAVTSAKVAPGVVDTEAQPNQEPLAYNGNMEVAQRGTSTTGLTNGSSGYHTVDRWKWHENGSPSSVWTMTQETLTSGNAYADGFNNALKIDCTTAQGSLGAGDTLHIEQRFEKQDLGAFKKGTANAQKFTFGFWVKATKTGTNIIELQDQGNDRAVSATYTISTTDTWEHKVVSFPADTTGNFGTGSDLGLIVRFYIYAGANYTSGSLQTAWGSSDTTKRANGQVNNADSTSNNWHLTGVQLEVGEFTSSTIPPFKHESFGENLARCQRYYYKFAAADGGYFGSGNIDGNNDAQIFVPFSVTMRTSPSAIETNGTASHYAIRTTFNTTCDVVPVFSNTDLDRALVIFKKTNHGITNGSAALGRSQNNTAYLAWSAEL
jgi:hypothetical protein